MVCLQLYTVYFGIKSAAELKHSGIYRADGSIEIYPPEVKDGLIR